MSGDLAGKVAIIVGASCGIGLEIAERLVADRARDDHGPQGRCAGRGSGGAWPRPDGLGGRVW
jgi:hypothetical protein